MARREQTILSVNINGVRAAEKRGSSSGATFSRSAPLSVARGLNNPRFDHEGRVLITCPVSLRLAFEQGAPLSAHSLDRQDVRGRPQRRRYGGPPARRGARLGARTRPSRGLGGAQPRQTSLPRTSCHHGISSVFHHCTLPNRRLVRSLE